MIHFNELFVNYELYGSFEIDTVRRQLGHIVIHLSCIAHPRIMQNCCSLVDYHFVLLRIRTLQALALNTLPFPFTVVVRFTWHHYSAIENMAGQGRDLHPHDPGGICRWGPDDPVTAIKQANSACTLCSVCYFLLCLYSA